MADWIVYFAITRVQGEAIPFTPFGGWYWTKFGADGYPLEPINAHGPSFFAFSARRAARAKLGSRAQETLQEEQ